MERQRRVHGHRLSHPVREHAPLGAEVAVGRKRHEQRRRLGLLFLSQRHQLAAGEMWVSHIAGQPRDAQARAARVPQGTGMFAGVARHREGWTTYPNRGRRHMEEWLTPYPADGQPVHVVMGCGRDLTELKTQAQQLGEQVLALQSAEQLKALIVDHALAAIVTREAAGCIVEFNPAAQAMFGLAREQALGRTVAKVMRC